MKKITPLFDHLKAASTALLVFVIIMISVVKTEAQIPLGVDVNVFPPYPTQYNVWISNAANYMITLQNNSDTEFDFYIRAGIEGVSGGEETFARISESYFPNDFLTIGPNEILTLTSADLEILYTDATPGDLDRSPNIPLDIDGELPEGTYQLCFTLMSHNPNEEIFLSPKTCSEPFNISHSTIQLVNPFDESTWDQTDVPITFQWQNMSSQFLTGDFEYELSIYELDANAQNEESPYEYIESGAPPFFRTDRVKDLSYIYDVDFGLPEFTKGNLYAARVEVFNNSGASYYDGNNFSNINTFWFGYNPNVDEDGDGNPDENETSDCFERCQVELPSNASLKTNFDDLESFKMGNFVVSELEINSGEASSTLSGIGTVQFSFLQNAKLAVQFENVQINTNNEALSGEMRAVTLQEEEGLLETLTDILISNAPLPEDKLEQLDFAIRGSMTAYGYLSGDPLPVPFSVGQTIGGQSYSFSLLGFEATPQNASLDFINALNFPINGEITRIGIGAADVCVAPDGFGSEFKLYMLNDLAIPIDNGMELTFKGGQAAEGVEYDIKNNPRPCYFELACEGVKALSLSGNIDFGQGMLIKEENNFIIEDESVKGYFSTVYERDFSQLSITNDVIPETDFIIDFVMDDFQLKDLPGYTFTLEEGSIDLSEIRNPNDIEFPKGYEIDGDVLDTWQGFYLKKVGVMAPKEFVKSTERRRAIINHLIIDPQLSMDVEAYGLLPYNEGVFKQWGIGIDTFELAILQNSLRDGRLQGQFGTPIMAEGDNIQYNFLVDQKADDFGNTYYAFEGYVSPNYNVQIPLAIADATICQSSYLALQFGKKEEEKDIEIFAKGDLDINTGNYGQALIGNARLRLADYQIHYNSIEGFISKKGREDGRGTYFGKNNNEENNCHEMERAPIQDLFDAWTAQIEETGRNIYSNISDNSQVDEVVDFINNPDDYLNGFPISFRNSNLEVIEGEPRLTLAVEARLNENQIAEAGLILQAGLVGKNNGKVGFAVTEAEIYFQEGMVTLESPQEGVGLAMDEDIQVVFNSNFGMNLREGIKYMIQMIEVNDENEDDLVNAFLSAGKTDFSYRGDTIPPVQTSGSVAISIDIDDLDRLEENERYAMVIRAYHPTENLINGGFSNINIVTWGQSATVGDDAGANSDCAERCSPELPEDDEVVEAASDITSFRMGNFTIELIGNINRSGNLISGEGKVNIPFLRMNVKVDYLNVGLNSSGIALQGTVTAQQDQGDFVSAIAGYIANNSDNTVVQRLAEFLDEGRIVTEMLTGTAMDLPLGIQIKMGAPQDDARNSIDVAVTDFRLTPTTSDVDFISMLTLPSLSEDLYIGLGARDVCIGPDGFGGEASFFLPQDLSIPIDGYSELRFIGGEEPVLVGASTVEPMSLQIDCDGFRALNISGSVTYPDDVFVKEDILSGTILEGEYVKGYFGLNLQKSPGDAYQEQDDTVEPRTDFILNYTMDPFQIKGLDGWGFELTEGVLDLSEGRNLAAMDFPDNYDYSNLPDEDFWTGFYLKRIAVRTPKSFTENGARGVSEINNFMIDPLLSLDAEAINMLPIEVGSYQGWAVGLDTIELTVLQNDLTQGKLDGSINAPVMKAGLGLDFRFLLQQKQAADGDYYAFDGLVQPTADLEIPLAIATASVCQSSYLAFQFDREEEGKNVEVFLKGDMDINTGNAGQSLVGSARLQLADYQIHYNSVNGFLMPEQVTDGRGSYLGVDNSAGNDCLDPVDMADMQDIFDAITEEIADLGDQAIDAMEENTQIDEAIDAVRTFNPDDYMGDLPISFSRSAFEVIDGAPKVSLIVEARVTEDNIIEAGMVIESERVQNGNSFNFGLSDFSTYFTQGMIQLNSPTDGSSLATDENISVVWEADLPPAQLARAEYSIEIIELTEDLPTNLDSLFREVSYTPFYRQDGLSGSDYSIVIQSLSEALTPTMQYAIRVRATDSDGGALVNDGYSNINIFTWGQDAIIGDNAGNNSACASRCSPALPSGTLKTVEPDLTEFIIGNFTVSELEITGVSGKLINGEGVVAIDFLNNVRLHVTFTDIGLNTQNEALQGVVNGKTSSGSLLGTVSDYLAGNTESLALDVVSQLAEEAELIAQVMTSGRVELPFGVNISMGSQDDPDSGTSVNANFTDFELTPTTSDVDFLVMMSFPAMSEQAFAVGAKDICIHPDGFGSEAKFYLATDIVIPLSTDESSGQQSELIFSGGSIPATVNNEEILPTYLEIDCDGFKSLNVAGVATFPQSMFVLEDTLTGQINPSAFVRGAFSLNLTRTGGDAYASTPAFLPDPEPRTDILIEFTMDPFQIKGLDGWGFVVRDAVLDLSESSNASYMSFPEGHTSLTDPNPELWTGFYLGEVALKSPAKFTEENTQGAATPYRSSVSIYSLLIDPQISLFINVDAEILAYEQASIKEWGISIDNLNLNIVQNTFVSAGLGGVVGSPIIGEQERIPYTASITRKVVSEQGSEEQSEDDNEDITEDNEDVSYVMSAVLNPPSDLTLPMMAAGFSVCQSSYLAVQIGKNEGETQMEIFLKGSINLDLEDAAAMAGAAVDIPGDFELALADFQVKYNTVDQFIMESDVTDGTGTSIGLGMNSGEVCAASVPIPDLDGLVARGISGDRISSNDSSSGNTDAVAESGMPGSNPSESDNESSEDEDEEAEPSNMAGFPIRLSDFGIEMANGNPAVSFTVDLALADGSDGFAAGASLTIHTREARPDRKLKIALDRVEFNCARLAVDMDALTLVGCLCHENDNGVNGYFGKVVVQTNGISLDLAGGFGTYQEEGATAYGEEDYYGMWYVDGTFASNQGIPMGPLTLNALGGGIYWNLEAPDLPSHNELEEAEEGEEEESLNAVSDCMSSLIQAYDIELPGGTGGALTTGSVTPRFGSRSIRVNAGLSLGSPKLAVMDPYVRVDWQAGYGIDMISVGGYLYLLQQDYMSRGAPRAPQEVPEGTTAQSGGSALTSSKMWMSFFNTITFDRTSVDPTTGEDRTLVAFEGTGSFYLNMIPDVLKGNAGGEEYRMISHDIYFGHVDHQQTRNRGYQVAGSGNTYWHAYFGNPYTSMGPGRVTFDLAGLFRSQSEESGAEENNETTESTNGAGLDITAYLMLGHGIPSELPPVPDMITSILNNTNANEGDDDNGGSFSGASTNDAEEREDLADKTSGFAFGTTVELNMGFDKIIYASLRVVLGMDFMIKNTNGTTCISGDNIYSPPGVEGFYGEGQIFAGLEGALGVRGRVMGRDIEVELMYLAAALLIEGGGPNPFWIRGRAAVSFRCLGGLIKGNANVDVSAGQPCIPYDADPFSLEIIDKVFPSPDHINDRAVNPYAAVKVSFKMPVADIDDPASAEVTVPVILPTGGYDIVKLAPVIDRLELTKKVGNNFYDVDGEISYSETGRTVRFIPTSPMAVNDQETDNKRHRIFIRLKAMERNGNSWNELSGYVKDSLVAFDAAPLDPYEEYVPYTNPIRGQRFFMADEWDNSPSKISNANKPIGKLGVIHFHKDIRSSKFYRMLNGTQYKYYAVWKEANSGDEVDRYELIPDDILYKKVVFPISTLLEPSTTYVLQIVRKAPTGKFVSGGLITSDAIKFSSTRGIESDYVIEYQEDDENPFEAVSGSETLIHMVAFATSRFDNLPDKMATVDLTLIPAYTTIGSATSTPWYSTANDQVELTGLIEPFEKIELKGITTSYKVPGESWTHAFTRARVQIVDPMEGDYYQNEVKPKMNNLLNKFDQKIRGLDVGLRKSIFPGLGSIGIYGYGPSSSLITFYSNRIKGYRYQFANNSMILDSYIGSRSYFASPLSQQPSTFGLNKFIINTYQLIDISGFKVSFEYPTRETVREEVADLVDWFEERIPTVKNGNFFYNQTLSASTVQARYGSTFSAYDDVIRSSFYDGNASTIYSIPFDPNRNAQIGNWTGFRTSEIDFFYNLDGVKKQTGQMFYYGSKATRILDD